MMDFLLPAWLSFSTLNISFSESGSVRVRALDMFDSSITGINFGSGRFRDLAANKRNIRVMISNFLFSKLWRAYLNAFYISPVIHGEKIAAAPRIHSPTIHNLDYIEDLSDPASNSRHSTNKFGVGIPLDL